MSTTLQPNAGAAKSGRYVTEPKKHWQDPIAARVAVQLCCSPLYAEKKMREANRFVELVVRAMRESGAGQRAERYLEGILRANEGREPPPDCEATWALVDAADAKEDTAQHRYERDKTPGRLKTRAEFIAALREDRRFITSTIDLLIDEQERTQQAAERQS